MRIGGVLLAAGGSMRFGAPKLLAPLPDGTPVAAAAARSLRAGVDVAVAVVRPEDRELAALLTGEGLCAVAFPGAARGMGASLGFGVEALGEAEGWVIALADMPFIQSATVHRVAAALASGAMLAAPSYQGRRGHPVGFARRWRAELTALDGDCGARDLLDRHAGLLSLCPTRDAGILRDIDVPQDLPARGG